MAATPESARRRAAALAGHTGDAATAAQAWHDPSPAVRIAALRSLARLDMLDEHTLTAALGDPAPTVRVAALELATGPLTPPVAQLLEDPDPMVAEAAAWALGERPDPEPAIVERLSILTRDHDDPLVREAAVAALGAIGDDRGRAAVLAATTDKPSVRRRAVVALAAFEGPDVDAALDRARHDRDRQVRDAAEDLLGPAES